MFDNVMTVGFSATFEILIAVALELVIGKFLFFDPVRWLKAGLNRLNLFIKKRLNQNARAKDTALGIAAPLVLGFAVLMALFGASGLMVRAVGPFYGSIFRIFLLYCCFSLRRPLWHCMSTLGALNKHDKESARRSLALVTQRDTGKMSEQGLIRAAVEETAVAVSEGGLLPGVFAVFGSMIPTYYGTLAMPAAFAAVVICSMCTPSGSPFDPRPGYTAALTMVGTYITMIPARLYSVLAIFVGWVMRFDPKAASENLIPGIIGEPALNRGWLFGVHSGLLGIRLGGGGYYGGAWKAGAQIGRDTKAVETGALRSTLIMGLASFAVGIGLTVFSALITVVFALIMSLLAVKNNNNGGSNYYGGGYR